MVKLGGHWPHVGAKGSASVPMSLLTSILCKEKYQPQILAVAAQSVPLPRLILMNKHKTGIKRNDETIGPWDLKNQIHRAEIY